MRAIDADKLYDKLLYDTTPTFTVNGGGRYIASFRVADSIESAPTITYEALVPHGEWEVFIAEETDISRLIRWSCSVCGIVADRNSDNYCPNCGAKMDGGG